MDKFSELSSNARKAANTFYNWSQLANCTSERVSCLTVEHLKETSELFSSLLSELEAKDKRIAELEAEITNIVDSHAETVAELRAKLEAKDKRIAELESIRADASQVLTEIGNELGCNPDNESIMMAIDDLKEREKRVVALAGGNAELWETMAARLEAAEAKLATPVRLPSEHELRQVACSECAGNCLELVEGTVRAAGFTVEEDEQ